MKFTVWFAWLLLLVSGLSSSQVFGMGRGRVRTEQRYFELSDQLISGGCEGVQWPPRDDRDRNCAQFRSHLFGDDATGCLPELDHVFAPEAWLRQGSTPILGFWRTALPYRYLVHRSPQGQITINVKIFLGDGLASEPEHARSIDQKLQEASELWTLFSPSPHLSFHFRRARRSDGADFSPLYVEGAGRGPYFYRWYSNWSAKVFAHEVGHMLGLVDEYDFMAARPNGHCDLNSLMCSTSGGVPMPFHYYVVLRRVRCAQFQDELNGEPIYPY